MKTISRLLFFAILFFFNSAFADLDCDAKNLFDWAEQKHPKYFSTKQNKIEGQTYYNGTNLYYTWYPQTNYAIGINELNEVYALGDVFGSDIVFVGKLSTTITEPFEKQSKIPRKLKALNYNELPRSQLDYANSNNTLIYDKDGLLTNRDNLTSKRLLGEIVIGGVSVTILLLKTNYKMCINFMKYALPKAKPNDLKTDIDKNSAATFMCRYINTDLGGKTFNLGVDGKDFNLGERFINAESVQKEMDIFINSVIYQYKIYNYNECGKFISEDSSVTNVTSEEGLLSVGKSTFFREVECNKGVCDFHFSIRDRFEDIFSLGIEIPFTTTYRINYDIYRKSYIDYDQLKIP